MTTTANAQRGGPHDVLAGLIPRALLLGEPERVGPRLSPDGRWVAWLALWDGVPNVWIRSTHSRRGERVLTRQSGHGVRQMMWAADSSRVLFTRDEASDEASEEAGGAGGDANAGDADNGDGQWRLWDVEVGGGAPRALTPESCQARLVAISPQRPGSILVALNLRRPQLHDVYRLDLAEGRLDLVCENPGDVLGWLAGPDLAVRAALAACPGGGVVVRVRDGEQAPWRALLQVGVQDAAATRLVGFCRDGTRLLCLTSHGGTTARLMSLDVATGVMTALVEDADSDVTDVWCAPGDGTPRAAWIQRVRTDLHMLDSDITDELLEVADLGGDIQVLDCDHADQVWLVESRHDTSPTRYYLYRRDTRTATVLFDDRPALNRYALAPMEPFVTRASDGLRLHGYVTFPPGRLARNDLPTVLLVHDGPWARDVWGLNPTVQWLANRGYLVLQINYRGSLGYGTGFLNAGNKRWGGTMSDDLFDALAHAIGHGWVDVARVAVMGRSYGGYAALMAAASSPDLVRCAVAAAPPCRLSRLIAAAAPGAAGSIARDHSLAQYRLRVGEPDVDATLLTDNSVAAHVGEMRSPLLIAHGVRDPWVPVADVDDLVDQARQCGVEVTYLRFADERHDWVNPANRLAYYGQVERFLAKHLGGRVEPDDSPHSSPNDRTDGIPHDRRGIVAPPSWAWGAPHGAS